MVNLHGRCFLTLKDFTPEEIGYLLDLAADLKAKKKKGIYGHSLENKNIALIFEKPSTRTRCAFTVGAQDEGGRAEYLGVEDIQLGKKESVEDTARVLGRMFDGFSSARRRAWRTPRVFSAVCSTGSSSADFFMKMSKSSRNTQAFRSGTVSRMTSIRPRFLRTF